MKLLFVFIVFFSFFEQKSFESKVSINELEINNYCFLYKFFGENEIKTQKYWQQINNGLDKLIFINIEKQQLSVLEFSDTFRIIFETRISSGKFKNSTPRGEFKIEKKRLSRDSKKYGGTMTFWNCLLPDESIGIHGLKDGSYEKHLGHPASHGCIRISKSIQKELYTIAPIGTKVIIE